ncbi:MAG TPA: hypothetical protein VI408_03610 [Gaiellaceae bacterium]
MTGAVARDVPVPHLKKEPQPVGAALAPTAAAKAEPLTRKVLTLAQHGGRRPQSAQRASDIVQTASQSVTSPSGVTGTMTVEGRIPIGNDGQPDPSGASIGLQFDMTRNGVKVAHGISVGLNEGFTMEAPCPTAAGDLHATSKLNVDTNTSVSPGGGVDYDSTVVNIHGGGSSHTTVNPDATLGKIAFSNSVSVTISKQVSLLHGLYVSGYRLTTLASWAGTVDAKSGNVTLSSIAVKVIPDGARGFGAGSFAADVAKVNADASLADSWRQLAIDDGTAIGNRYKDAEERFRKPNECAKLTFAPASDDHLSQGSTTNVQGRIGPKAGGSSDSVWDAPTVARGQVKGLPSRTAAARPVQASVTGDAPDSSRITASFDEQARSRAGIATAHWVGKDSGWLVTISGPVTGVVPCCWLVTGTAFAQIRVVQQTVGGVTGFHGSGTWADSGLSVVPNGLPQQCTFALSSVTGSPTATITPSSDGATLSVMITMPDAIDGTMTCPSPIPPAQIGGGFASSYYLQSGGAHPTVTVPADGSGSATIAWTAALIPGAAPATGRLVVTVKPL